MSITGRELSSFQRDMCSAPFPPARFEAESSPSSPLKAHSTKVHAMPSPPMTSSATRQSQSAASIVMVKGAATKPREPVRAWNEKARPMRSSWTAADMME